MTRRVMWRNLKRGRERERETEKGGGGGGVRSLGTNKGIEHNCVCGKKVEEKAKENDMVLRE